MNVLPATNDPCFLHCLLVQIDARKRIDKLGEFRDVVADMIDIYFHDTKLIALVLIADPAAARDRGIPVLIEAVKDDD